MMTKKEKNKICIACQECCKAVMIPTILTLENEESLDFYTKRGFEIYVPPKRKRVDLVINFPCPQLNKHGCKIYKKRPQVCKDYHGGEDFGEQCKLPV